jgi:hypothetical protein
VLDLEIIWRGRRLVCNPSLCPHSLSCTTQAGSRSLPYRMGPSRSPWWYRGCASGAGMASRPAWTATAELLDCPSLDDFAVWAFYALGCLIPVVFAGSVYRHFARSVEGSVLWAATRILPRDTPTRSGVAHDPSPLAALAAPILRARSHSSLRGLCADQSRMLCNGSCPWPADGDLMRSFGRLLPQVDR